MRVCSPSPPPPDSLVQLLHKSPSLSFQSLTVCTVKSVVWWSGWRTTFLNFWIAPRERLNSSREWRAAHRTRGEVYQVIATRFLLLNLLLRLLLVPVQLLLLLPILSVIVLFVFLYLESAAIHFSLCCAAAALLDFYWLKLRHPLGKSGSAVAAFITMCHNKNKYKRLRQRASLLLSSYALLADKRHLKPLTPRMLSPA